MPTIQYRPTSAGRRFQTGYDFAEITKSRPEKALLAPLTKSGGRNNRGRVTAYHRGGGHKRRYRQIDFRREKDGVPAIVKGIAEWARSHGARSLYLQVAEENTAAIATYEKLGFVTAYEYWYRELTRRE